MRTYQSVWYGMCGALAMVGAGAAFAWTVRAMLVLLCCAAAVGGAATVTLYRRSTGTHLSAREVGRRVSAISMLTGVATVSVVGLSTLFGPPTWLVLAVVAGTSPYAVRRCCEYLRERLESGPTGHPSPDVMVVAQPPERPSDPQSLTDTELCMAWRASFTALQRASSPSQWSRTVEARRAYLDELERRYPQGITVWLASGARAAGDPARFMVTDTSGTWKPIDWDRLLHGLDS